MTRIIWWLLFALSSTAWAQRPLELAPNAPDRHVVVRGDTLWDISGKFLKDPWRWPELWRLNREQIRNPHLIYPGQVLMLDLSGGTPQLRIGKPVGVDKLSPKVYEESSLQAVPSIPQNIIEPFLSEPRIVEENGLARSAKIIAIPEDRVYAGNGDTIYATGVAPEVGRWQIFRPERPITDPETKQVIGYEAFHLGSARVERDGDPATVQIVVAKQEIGRGDRMLPAASPEIVAYAPHAPEQAIRGQIASLYGGIDSTGETGRNYVVILNRGTLNGLEVGHVLALYRDAREVSYKDVGASTEERYTIPEERYGLVFVFRVFDRIAYALVTSASRPVKVGDIIRTP